MGFEPGAPSAGEPGSIASTPSGGYLRDAAPSWMMPTGKLERLLYVSDVGTDDVDVYSFPHAKLMGQLTGFHEPQGMCVDPRSGDVIVSDTLDSKLLEYAPGGTKPVKTFLDAGQYPVGCGYADGRGIEVANVTTSSGGPASVSVYRNPRHPDVYSDPELFRADFIGCMSDTCFITGSDALGVFKFLQLSSNGTFTRLDLGDRVASPAGVQYAGTPSFPSFDKYMAVWGGGDNLYLTQGGGIIGGVTLYGLCDPKQFFVTGSKIVVPDACLGKVIVYPYPKGRIKIQVFSDALRVPVGAAVTVTRVR